MTASPPPPPDDVDYYRPGGAPLWAFAMGVAGFFAFLAFLVLVG